MKKHLKREIKITNDGSHTLYIPELNEHYHSIHGAIQESNHIFIKHGLDLLTDKKQSTIFEVGLGTGLNALLAMEWAHKNNIAINFISIEKYPLSELEYKSLNYNIDLSVDSALLKIHDAKWNKEVEISEFFKIHKIEGDLNSEDIPSGFDGVFFDAFAPDIQPNLWETTIFKQLYDKLNPSGFLVTYCAKGQVRRNMIDAGFTAERLPGPPGKREILRCIKTATGFQKQENG